MHRIRPLLAAATVAATAVVAGCSGDIHSTYGTFRGAVRRGAPCTELFDQRARFDDADTLARIDGELERIGCTSPGATRTDR